MDNLHKLVISLKIGIILMTIPLFFLKLRNHLIIATIISVILVVLVLISIFNFKNKKLDYKFIVVGYAVGGILLLLGIVLLTMVLFNFSINALIVTLTIIFFSLIILYYSYKSQKTHNKIIK
ncbi:hypothetical protein COU56_02105 [Candidatus Pacearchaeota archaeon CG10_big_fil_rev_8_21_14_0_10_31_9]|nr:MAG: hypothetical protein AUJ62_03280 [Candidatus Pacearchaeota archaeon CG1_02_32_21]PIN95107.1 MAG: hypothetical protein COU56_02105 [Candidatus Pacearchaeota archaeon CG10_big_fil_rev_8_21_14_0_10_31_9]PIZ83740.1 MAG: hypothetical protein COX97_00640 [Candidatus Pacearchaeota archaeon CG_4_10_14_0_2_um_filter_05_32_18]